MVHSRTSTRPTGRTTAHMPRWSSSTRCLGLGRSLLKLLAVGHITYVARQRPLPLSIYGEADGRDYTAFYRTPDHAYPPHAPRGLCRHLAHIPSVFVPC